MGFTLIFLIYERLTTEPAFAVMMNRFSLYLIYIITVS